MKQIKSFFKSGFRLCTGHSLATQLYYWEGKPQIGYIIRRHYVIFWIPGYDRIGAYATQKEAVDSAKELGITL